MLLLIPQTIIFFWSESILLLLRQDPAVAAAACQYLKVLALGMPGYAGFECVRRWLQAQGLMMAPVVALGFAAPLNALLNWLLVWGPWDWCRLGFVGAPLASAMSMNMMVSLACGLARGGAGWLTSALATQFFVSLLYAYYFAPRDAWGGFSKGTPVREWRCLLALAQLTHPLPHPEMFTNLGENVKLGLAGTAMTASEWWSWEIIGLASSFLGPEALAAQSILLTSASLFYQVSLPCFCHFHERELEQEPDREQESVW